MRRLRRSAPLLLGAFVACSAAAAGLTNTIEEPRFELMLHLMIALAVGVSALATLRGVSSSWLGVVVIAMAAASVSQRGLPLPVVGDMFPAEALADEDLMWATLWGWLMIGLCFTLSARRNVLFCLVAGLAMFGLTATVNLNTAMMIYFAIMVFAAVFVWGYEHLLNLAEGGEGAQTGAETPMVQQMPDWWRLARTQVVAGSLLVTGVVVAGIAIGTVLYAIGPRLYLQPGAGYRYARWIQTSLLSYGGMLNSFNVGRGPVVLPSAPALEIKAETGHLWRGQAYDQYTGQGWNRRVIRTDDLISIDGWWRVPGENRIPGERLVQQVKLLTVDSRALFAAARPVAVHVPRQVVEGHDLQFRAEMDVYQCLMTTFRMPPGTEFEVISAIPPDDAQTLRATPARYPEEILSIYVRQVPPAALAELEDLVAELTAGAKTPYDKVVALRDYIEGACAYSDRAPAVPAGEDVASYFIKQSQVGACDLFATALAVMCRIAGVPARVATGFMTGQYHPDRQAFVPLQRDAHAWTEVYFTGVGWVPFDAAAERVESGGGEILALNYSAVRQRLLQALDRIWGAALVMIGILALASALVGPGLLWRTLRLRLTSRSPRVRLGEVYDAFARRALRQVGLRPERWRTPREVMQELVASGAVAPGPAMEELERLTERFYQRRYGPTEPSAGQLRAFANRARRVLGLLHARSRSRRGEGT